jgi:small-conductance mechanosensitive channel
MHRRGNGAITAIKTALDEAGIEIPFPYRTLTFKEPLGINTRAGTD